MILVMCSVYDSAVGAYMRPFGAPSRAAAQRSFSDEVNRAGSDMSSHPEDYVLHHVGEFDDEAGCFRDDFSPSVIVRGKDVLRVPQ